jgi:hypothetical protein
MEGSVELNFKVPKARAKPLVGAVCIATASGGGGQGFEDIAVFIRLGIIFQILGDCIVADCEVRDIWQASQESD